MLKLNGFHLHVCVQLAVLATYVGDELLALYRYFRSLAVELPFGTARDNLVLLFEKVRKKISMGYLNHYIMTQAFGTK